MKVTYIDHCGSDLSVVNAARVSFKKKSDTLRGDDVKLLKYLVRGCSKEDYQEYLDKIAEGGKLAVDDGDWGPLEKAVRDLIQIDPHHSPYNHAFLTMHVKAPIFVARQLVKHKFMPWNEVSRRYVDDEPEFYFPEVWRAKSKDKKQGSDRTLGIYNEHDEILEDGPYFTVQDQASLCLEFYRTMIEKGVCPEQARMVLPLNTYTEWYWSGTLGAWLDMYNLRSKPDTQEETREIALQCGEIIQNYFPYSFEVYSR